MLTYFPLPFQNIDFMPTILSRFDMIFIVKDEHEQGKDMVSCQSQSLVQNHEKDRRFVGLSHVINSLSRELNHSRMFLKAQNVELGFKYFISQG